MEKHLNLKDQSNKLKGLSREVEKLKKSVQQVLKNKNLSYGISRALRKLFKEIALQQNYVQGIKNWQAKKGVVDLQKIQIGGGSHVLEGYFNVDIVPPADLVWDVREGLPFPDACCEFIFSEHFLEHIDYPISVKRFIGECFRILKPNGKIVIGVPDGGLAAKKYATRDKKFYQQMIEKWYSKRDCLEHFNTYIDLLNYVFRDQDDDKKYNPHFWAYDFEKLESLFKEAGFPKAGRWPFDESIANPKREWRSIYVVATKG